MDNNDYEVLVESKILPYAKSNRYGLYLGLTLTFGVVAAVTFFLSMGDIALPDGAEMVMYICAVLTVIFLVITILYRSGEDLGLFLETNANNDVIFSIAKKDTVQMEIINPDNIEYFYFIELTGPKMNLKMKQLVMHIFKEGKCEMILQETYGAAYSPPTGWPEMGLTDVITLHQNLGKDIGGVKDIYYTIMDMNANVLERIVASLD